MVLLVLHDNPDWQQGAVDCDAVCDAIATFRMARGKRRDSGDGCHRWIFHFDGVQEVHACRSAMLQRFGGAFCIETNENAIKPPQPMAFAVVVTQVRRHDEDILDYPFFYASSSS